MIEFRTRLWDKDGEFVADAIMGRASVDMEIDHLPVGWRIEVTRTHRSDDPPSIAAQVEDYVTERTT